jgi:elongation factor 1-beta
MARLVVRIRILPAEAESNLENVSESIKRSLPEGMELKSSLMIGDFLLDDAEGQMDKLEECIKSVEGVGEIEVTNISRQSVRMKQ